MQIYNRTGKQCRTLGFDSSCGAFDRGVFSFGCRGKIRYNRLIEDEGWVHVVGEVKPFAVITEGPLKADVLHALTGLTVISVPGVNTLSHLKTTLEEMKSRGLCEIKTAFDMDMMTNHNVRNGFLNLMELLDSMDFKFGTYVWDARYKGLDDYVWECVKKDSETSKHKK